MALASSGDNLEFHCPDTGIWTPIEQMRFEEARVYRWRSTYSLPFDFRWNGIPLPMVRSADGWEGEWATPFQSGHIAFEIRQAEQKSIPSYVYPDKRKLTEAEYERMLSDILEEAAACYQHSGASLAFDGSGLRRQVSMAQWDYIDRTFYRLQQLFRNIEEEPLRRLRSEEQWIRREKVKHVTPALLAWAERHPGSGMTDRIPVPTQIWTGIREDTCDVYENKVLKRQLKEIMHLLRQYREAPLTAIRERAESYADRIQFWLRSAWLKEVGVQAGPIVVSQVFRKHPIYRQWFDWFQQLYRFRDYSVGMSRSIPLKDTYQLYEIWVFMKLAKLLRENGCLADSSEIFSLEQDGLVLNLSEKKESRIRLIGGATLAYQRWFTSSTQPFGTYTHGMKPDIVLEANGKLFVFDPKYRLDHNLPMALGEMHKYRDGVVRQEDGERVVEQVYIVTPAPGQQNAHFFDDSYREKHRMGAYWLKPGMETEPELVEKIMTIVEAAK